MNHEITVTELLEWKADKLVEYASSHGRVNKQLYATLNGGFEVHHNRVKVFECIQPYLAVEKYNSIDMNTPNPINSI